MTAAENASGATKAASGAPAVPPTVKDADASKEIMHTLRHFHLGNPQIRDQLEPLAADLLPALLSPYRDTSKIRYDYPLFLYPPADETPQEGPGPMARPLADFLSEITASFAPGDSSARILKDNLPRLEWAIRDRLGDREAPVEAKPIIAELAASMREELHLDQESDEKLGADLEQLLEALPEQGKFLAYGRYPAIYLLTHVIQSRVAPRQKEFTDKITTHIRDLRLLLDVEHEKSQEAIEPDSLRDKVGFGATLFDHSALSEVMDHSHGSISMPPERLQRIEEALQTLESYQSDAVGVRIVHTGNLDQPYLEELSGFEIITAETPCITATELFDQAAEQLAKVFAAARIAQLEIENLYDQAIHDPWFENFTWEAFSKEELLLVPAVIALENADRMAGAAMYEFSQLLNSGRPIHILVRVLAHANPGSATDQDPFSSFRTELGYLGISHRQAVVSQVSSARHEQLLKQFTTALESTRTSLHLLNVGLRPTGQDTGLNAWLVAGAALEGRVHPFFHIDPSAGDSFAERMDFSGNPQPEKDWPTSPFSYLDENGQQVDIELAFTFADYALLISNLSTHFTPVPLICQSEDLIPVAEYLEQDPGETEHCVPYILAVNKDGDLYQLAITRTLVQACRDRLNYWHMLQEMAGVQSRYVDLAVAEARREITQEADRERQQLQESHQQALQEARAEAAGEVMGRLTDVLMGMDFSSGAPQPRTPAPAATEPEETEAAEAPAEETQPVVEEEEALSFDEPWIDSVLCTSCNDCMTINAVVFVYNDDNQAILTDPSAATFAELVEAAEICPSNCIHPGKPLNANEPGLEDLMQRAAPYN